MLCEVLSSQMEVAIFSAGLVHFCKVACCHNTESLLIVAFKELFVDFGKILVLACTRLQKDCDQRYKG
jgi:hypothetical protein